MERVYNSYSKYHASNSLEKSWLTAMKLQALQDEKLARAATYALYQEEQKLRRAQADRLRRHAEYPQHRRDNLISDCSCHAYSDPAGRDCPNKQVIK